MTDPLVIVFGVYFLVSVLVNSMFFRRLEPTAVQRRRKQRVSGPKGKLVFLALAFLAPGLMCGYVAVTDWPREIDRQHLSNDGVEVDAIVTASLDNEGKGEPRVEWKFTDKGKEYTGGQNVSGPTQRAAQEGKTILIHFYPLHPSTVSELVGIRNDNTRTSSHFSLWVVTIYAVLNIVGFVIGVINKMAE